MFQFLRNHWRRINLDGSSISITVCGTFILRSEVTINNYLLHISGRSLKLLIKYIFSLYELYRVKCLY